MSDDDRGAPPKRVHEIGEKLDQLSLHEFDERIAALKAEIARLEGAKERKRQALDDAGSVFRSASPRS